MFVIETVYSEPEMTRAQNWHWKKYRMLQHWWTIGGALAVVIGLAYATVNFALGGLLMVYGGYCLLRKRMLGSQFLKSIRSSPDLGKTVRWTVSEERIVQEIGESAAQISWTSILQSIITPDGILVYTQKNVYFWIPTDCLEGTPGKAALNKLVEFKTRSKKLS